MATPAKFPTKKAIAKLSRAEVDERLKTFGLEPQAVHHEIDEFTGRCIADDDPWSGRQASGCRCEEYTLTANRSRLHQAPIRQWIEGLDLKEALRAMKEYRITLSAWEKRSLSLPDLKKKLEYGLPEFE